MTLPVFPGIPATITSYDAATRSCRVSIPGVTDGAEVMPLAMMLYGIGEKSAHTDVRILAGDLVWVAFVNGDDRYPVIIGYRTKESSNAIDVRRLHHKNIELTADTDMILEATDNQVTIKAGTKVRIEAPEVEVVATTKASVTAPVVTVDASTSATVTSPSVTVNASATAEVHAPVITLDGAATVTGTLLVQGLLTYGAGIAGTGTATANGIDVGSTHRHSGVQMGSNSSGPPEP